MSKIYPRNLTARAAYRVQGNPESTRLESGVGNCFPGLEFDHRNLDRRFLPGVVVEFVSADEPPEKVPQSSGARLVELNALDPGLTASSSASPDEQSALAVLRQQINNSDIDPTTQTWYISAITQAGIRIDLAAPIAGGGQRFGADDAARPLPHPRIRDHRPVGPIELGLRVRGRLRQAAQ